MQENQLDKEHYMNLALEEARTAFRENETPIGCIIVNPGGEIIGRGHNMVAARRNSLYHAEIIAINQACQTIGDWRLDQAALFVTIEPCPMCAGAIVMSRIGTVVYGAKNPKGGCGGSIFNILQEPRFNHRVNLHDGVLAQECGALMTDFFRNHLNRS